MSLEDGAAAKVWCDLKKKKKKKKHHIHTPTQSRVEYAYAYDCPGMISCRCVYYVTIYFLERGLNDYIIFELCTVQYVFVCFLYKKLNKNKNII